MVPKPHFEVSSEGLSQLVAGRGKGFVVNELISNALDEETQTVEVVWEHVPGKPLSRLVVDDDNPGGFKDLSHAYTVFAPSEKKQDAHRRGRFNFGEKLVISQCVTASIATTTGTVEFDEAGRHHHPRRKRSAGSRFEGLVRCTRQEHADVDAAVRQLIIPSGVTVMFNGEALPHREPVANFTATLETVLGDGDGVLRRSKSKTDVRVYEPLLGEEPTLYELGIPVVATGDRWHVDVGQKVPLTMERDNVRPAFLRALRAAVLNHMSEHLDDLEAAEDWVSNALEDPDVSDDTVRTVLDRRYGVRRVISDPSDPEANKIAMSQGYTVIPPRAHSKAAWKAIRTSGAALPAGRVTPSPRPYSDDPDAPVREELAPDLHTPAIRRLMEFSARLGERLIGVRPRVVIINDAAVAARATFGPAGGSHPTLEFNYAHLGAAWLEQDPASEAVLSLLIHELGHHICGDHFSHDYFRALTDLGARLARLALSEPELFRDQP